MNIPSVPVVSVIIPVYNVENYLVSCIQSIRKQTFGDLEIILVDDGSTDSSGRLCDVLSKEDDRIRVVHKKNTGLGMARNTGLDHARGEWVMFVDSDDFIAVNAIEHCLDIADRERVDQVRFLFEHFKDGDNVSPENYVHPGSFCMIGDRLWEKMEPMMAGMAPLYKSPKLKAPSEGSACTALYRRRVIEQYGLRFHSEREFISEDYLFNIEYGVVCGPIAYTGNRFYFYRENPDSLTRLFRSDRVERSVKYCDYLEKRLRELGYGYASHFAMGSMMGYLRDHTRHIFASPMSGKEKRKMYEMAVRHPYVDRMAREYRFTGGTLLPRIAFFVRNSYFMSKMLYSLNDFRKRWS